MRIDEDRCRLRRVVKEAERAVRFVVEGCSDLQSHGGLLRVGILTVAEGGC